MKHSKNRRMQFLFADRELILEVSDLLKAPTDVIVNPANSMLSHGGGVAAQISQQGGAVIQHESDLFLKQHGALESGMVAFTSAGALPYAAVIHAVGPHMGEGDEQYKLELAIARSLQLCEMHHWHSIALPAISSGIFAVPLDIVARAFFRAITSFWDARPDGAPDRIIICLTENNFQPFFTAFQQNSKVDSSDESRPKMSQESDEASVGIVELSDQDLLNIENDEINDWFK